jgi:NCS1 family nucleobase:cation symporter-1
VRRSPLTRRRRREAGSAANVSSLLPAWWRIYGWFFGVGIGGVVYYALSVLRPRPIVAGRVGA